MIPQPPNADLPIDRLKAGVLLVVMVALWLALLAPMALYVGLSMVFSRRSIPAA